MRFPFTKLNWCSTTAILSVGLLGMFFCRVDAEETTAADFNRDVRPILSDKCFQCHGPDDGERATDLRLDIEQDAKRLLDSGAIAIVEGDTQQSELLNRITHPDDDVRMPPVDSGKSLSRAEIATIRSWIESGAQWSDHWSFVPPVKPRLPTSRTSWARNPIDLFVEAKLIAKGMRPSAVATKERLIRRVAFDLTGLPPTPVEVRRFVNDHSPDAYERLVDRLLDSPRYGEHMARYWLDAARYGDTHGLHLDNERSIWPFRDWVINAFNANMPFDQFTIEQLAGDLLEDPSHSQLVATGFNRCNVTTSEGGSIDEEYLVRYAVDRIETTSTVWLGLTAGCAACHDHKFDPISQKEFYSLFAFFFSQTEKAMDGNALLPPPTIKSPTATQLRKQKQIDDDIARIAAAIATREKEMTKPFRKWERHVSETRTKRAVPRDHVLHASFDRFTGNHLSFGEETTGTVIGKSSSDAGKFGKAFRFDGKTAIEIAQIAPFDTDDAFSFGAWVYRLDDSAMTVLSKMDDANGNRGYDLYIHGGKVFVHLINHWQRGIAIRVNTRQPVGREKWQHVMATYDGSGKAAGVQVYVDGNPQELEITHDRLSGTITTRKPFRIGRRTDGAPYRGMIDELRIFARTLSADEVQTLADVDPIGEILSIASTKRSVQQHATLLRHFLLSNDAEYQRLLVDESNLRTRKTRLESTIPSTLVMRELQKPRQAHVLVRGQYDQPGEPVFPNVPSALPPLPVPDGQPSTRLDFAKWLVDPSHPLTARVTVNRIWQQYFGVGIVKSTGDFGSQGDWPSHPELLDWLAIRFIDSGWNLKALHRLIVTSSTYRQSSNATKDAYTTDPDNRLLARGPRHRLDAEQIRDNAMLVSGLLHEQLGGGSVKPYQPDGLWKAVGYTSSNTARFKRDHGQDLYRRGVYTFWKRTSPPPMMQIFDAPSREVCTVRRPKTNTPSAALVLMNDIQFVEASRHFAKRIICDSGPQLTSRIRYAFQWATSRSPTDDEIKVIQSLVNDYKAHFLASPAEGKQLLRIGESDTDTSIDSIEYATWTMLASTLLNLDETITKQ